MPDAHANFAYSTVLTAPSPASSGTSLVLQSGDGAKCPAVPFNATVWPAGALPLTTNAEIVRVTARSTDTLTITRAQESSSARSIIVGDQFAVSMTAKTFTDIEGDLTAALTQTTIQAAQIAAELRADTNYYVGAGCAYSANATPTKLDVTAGVILIGTTDKACTAQTAISTTIASLADATNPKWVVVEIDTSGVTQFNQGTAAASPAIPTFTASRVPAALIYIPANATNVDALLTTSNGLAKLIDIRVVRSGPSITGWCYDTQTWTYASATTFTVTDASHLKKGMRVSYNDGAVDYGVVAGISGTTVTLITTSDYSIANAALTAPRYSHSPAPQGYPTWFNWTCTLSGWSADPTNTIYKWKCDGGNQIMLNIRQQTAGTSNSTTHTGTLPVTAATLTNQAWINPNAGSDNGAANAGSFAVSSAGTTVAMRGTPAATNTASGTSQHSGQITYEF